MKDQFERTRLLIGNEGLARLASAHVAVFGIGGVGGFAIEALARAGVGTLTIVDNDTVDLTNLNRQIIATHKTIGKEKTLLMKQRIEEINPQCKVNERNCFFLPETADQFDFSQYDFVLDAVDTVTAKLELIVRAKASGVPIISSMGTGNKLDPTAFELTDISKTSVCPLAKVIRKELKNRQISNVPVLYSKEEPCKNRPPGSISFVPPVAGFILAGEVIKQLIEKGGR